MMAYSDGAIMNTSQENPWEELLHPSVTLTEQFMCAASSPYHEWSFLFIWKQLIATDVPSDTAANSQPPCIIMWLKCTWPYAVCRCRTVSCKSSHMSSYSSCLCVPHVRHKHAQALKTNSHRCIKLPIFSVVCRVLCVQDIYIWLF